MPLYRRYQFVLRTLCVVALFSNCAQQHTDRRSRPSEDGTVVPGFISSAEKTISPDDGGEISLGDVKISLPRQATVADVIVRMGTKVSSPDLTESEAVVLGSPIGAVVTVAVFDPISEKTLASPDLLSPYEFKQTFRTSNSTSNIGLMIVVDEGTAAEQRILLPNSELTIERGTEASESGKFDVTVSVKLRVTSGTMWLVNYTDDALTKLNISTADTLSSVGGAAVAAIANSDSGGGSRVLGTIVINSGAAYTTNAAVTLSLSSENAAEMYVTNSSGCSDQGVWEAFESSRAWTLAQTNGVARVYAKFRETDMVESECVSASVIRDEVAPSAPSNVQVGATSSSLTDSPTISWVAGTDSGSGIAAYEVAIGSSAGQVDVKNWASVGSGTTAMISGMSLTQGHTYYVSIRAKDNAGLYSNVVVGNGWLVSNFVCPTGFIRVPADASSEVNTAEFCVMKYEAKKVNNVATSQASSTPWIAIQRGANALAADSAWKACAALGAGYDLISNAQWQAIARNIETAQSAPGVYLNWSNGSTSGSNAINRGHSDNNPNTFIAGGTDDNPCSGTGNTSCADNTSADFTQKRTHTLSNGEVIWDFAGNVTEWVKNDSAFNYGAGTRIALITATYGNACTAPACNGPQGKPKAAFGPIGNYSSKGAPEYGGLGYGNIQYTLGAATRGGFYSASTASGIFNVELGSYPSATSMGVGFRCAYNAQ